MADKRGQQWVLLRGLARESAHWGDFLPQLQAQFPAATITALDLPGTGQFCAQPSPDNIAAITEHVRAQAMARGLLAQPVTLLAVSLGAMVAWEWLQRYPDDCCGAVLMNTSFASLSPFYQRLRWQSYRQFAAALMQRDVYRRELGIVRLVGNRPGQYETVAQAWAAIQTARPLQVSNAIRQLRAAASYRPALTPPLAPVLLLNGLGDRLVSPACTEAIHQHYGLTLRRHPWAGHDLTLDDGGWVRGQVCEWLAEPG
ncbi:alpha/beta fold hydrolase [Methylovulum psychrotolerans]|uniref:Alpha/beta hydrolase n=1 Tax=Methylovulum psychrotolerans TaxID=1704499 RepID=A0A2S5CM97_9GAMM|nr:alpha/beta hydrolase [Methylovulum psychrotolerans]POZ51872.1 alpha/beta hydrolase [Methylovulum psychrotolerans]